MIGEVVDESQREHIGTQEVMHGREPEVAGRLGQGRPAGQRDVCFWSLVKFELCADLNRLRLL